MVVSSLKTRPLIIGICEGTGSGKTTITDRLIQALSESSVLVLQQDHYYKHLPISPRAERARQNFDHPHSMDTPLLIEHVRRLRQGEAIERPAYDFIEYRRLSQTVRLEPRPAIILEGILIFESKALRELMDLKIFVDTDADLRFIRRLVGDIHECGRTMDSVIEQHRTTVRPMHMEFVEPSKRHADVIIPEGGYNEVGIDLVIQKFRLPHLAPDLFARVERRRSTRFHGTYAVVDPPTAQFLLERISRRRRGRAGPLSHTLPVQESAEFVLSRRRFA